jgi:hypothetical protein
VLAGTFSDKTSRVLKFADISNFDGRIRTVEVETKPKKVDAFGAVVKEAQVETVMIGIGKCVVTPDGVPMKLNSMLKVHLWAELQVSATVFPHVWQSS